MQSLPSPCMLFDEISRSSKKICSFTYFVILLSRNLHVTNSYGMIDLPNIDLCDRVSHLKYHFISNLPMCQIRIYKPQTQAESLGRHATCRKFCLILRQNLNFLKITFTYWNPLIGEIR